VSLVRVGESDRDRFAAIAVRFPDFLAGIIVTHFIAFQARLMLNY
jgi:hypothetical protein